MYRYIDVYICMYMYIYIYIYIVMHTWTRIIDTSTDTYDDHIWISTEMINMCVHIFYQFPYTY